MLDTQTDSLMRMSSGCNLSSSGRLNLPSYLWWGTFQPFIQDILFFLFPTLGGWITDKPVNRKLCFPFPTITRKLGVKIVEVILFGSDPWIGGNSPPLFNWEPASDIEGLMLIFRKVGKVIRSSRLLTQTITIFYEINLELQKKAALLLRNQVSDTQNVWANGFLKRVLKRIILTPWITLLLKVCYTIKMVLPITTAVAAFVTLRSTKISTKRWQEPPSLRYSN